MTDYAISKKSKRSLWIPILVFITLAACASAGYSYWHSHQVAADDKAQQRVVPSPVFYALDTFTVNLGDADRVLYIGITLRLKDEATRSRLSEYLPEVRSRLLLLFSRQDAAVLATEEGKKNLIARLKPHFPPRLLPGNRNRMSPTCCIPLLFCDNDMGDSILSQAEIDALLNGDSEVKDEPTASVSGESDIRPYDPNTQRRVVRERLQALEIINERFARHFRMGLFNLLRRSPDITVGAIRIQPYHEFARNLPVPTNLNLIHLKPLRGTGLVVFSPSLVFIAVDNLFGGDGRFPTKVEGREFTHTEQRVINRMLKLALEGYSDAWKAINPLEVEYVRSEMQVKFTNITTSPNDIVVNTPFHVEIGNLTGEFNICLPFSMIEPLRELLVNPPLENSRNEDQNWRDNLVRQVQHSQLELVANFADISLRLSQILKLKPGDVLPIEKPDRIIAHVDGVPVLTSQYGTLNGQYALRIEHLINPILNSLNEEQPK